ncbi:MAG: ATP-binding protein [Bacteroidales bacterium]|jgi:hypothetical protein|nr:ATP-binding protein [Bacteroidales bacterium]
MERKKLPVGCSNFESLIEQGYYYVDKTHFIEKIENERNKTVFFIRPRKFGKSLFLTMMWNYYDVRQADKFETLFGEYYIGKHPTPLHNKYVVINFDFSGIDTGNEDVFRNSFTGKIQANVRTHLIRYEKKYPKEVEKLFKAKSEGEYQGIEAINMIFDLAESICCKVYVIIDEYDHFANDIVASATTDPQGMYRKMVGANSIVRDFYETLKAGTKSIVDRVVITGVTPIMLDDMTSGFNISNNLSTTYDYNELLGFTQAEVDKMIADVGIDMSNIPIDLKQMYEGYKFHAKAENLVYNSSMMLFILDKVQFYGIDALETLIDDNLKMDYSRLRNLMITEERRQILTDIARNGSVEGAVIPKFSLHQLSDNKCFISMLFYMGLITLKKVNEEITELKIPNYSIYTVYWDYILQMLEEENDDISIDTGKIQAGLREWAFRNNPYPYVDYISKNIVARLSNRDLQRFDEKYLKFALLNYMNLFHYYIPLSEVEVTEGYPDVYLKRTGLYPSIPCDWVVELKYIKQSDARKPSVLEAKLKEARKQIAKYRASQVFNNRADVQYRIFVFTWKNKFEIYE